ncbi:MAG: ATP-dependent DNA ligase [Candidatus Poseidoniia archaeon]|nr:ATP-dependent DNA ligase [Candidatus Poseidoniia archaeon]
MDYGRLTEAYAAMEQTRSRLEIATLLAELFRATPPEELAAVAHLCLGKLGPAYDSREVGLSDKSLLRTLALASGAPLEELQAAYAGAGDIGLVAEQALAVKAQQPLFGAPLTVGRVWERLHALSLETGTGSQERKFRALAELLHDGTPQDARYICRTAVGKLRLGFSQMLLVDGLAEAFGSREERGMVEAAYNRHPDIGWLAQRTATDFSSLADVRATPGIPLRPMLGERLSSAEAVLEKHEGESCFEWKYDGLRVQAHLLPGGTRLFSRSLEDLTPQFPDVVEALEQVLPSGVIVEGEALAIDKAGNLLPFQVIAKRRGRKHGLAEKLEEIPVGVRLFDLLYADKQETLDIPFAERRERLEVLFTPSDRVACTTLLRTANAVEAEQFLLDALEGGCEGLMSKALDGGYRAGARGWQWIKYKPDYRSDLVDTIDAVVVGGFHGRGRRGGFWGALLMATRTPTGFETVCKLGSGFSDEDLAALKQRLDTIQCTEPPAGLEWKLEPDAWFEPELVLELLGAEISQSPIHTCGGGYAVRFPRYKRQRDDKTPETATSSDEVVEMFKQ